MSEEDTSQPADDERDAAPTQRSRAGRAPTVVEARGPHRALIVTVLTVLGFGLGLVAPVLIDRAQRVDWLPFHPALRWLDRLSSDTGSWVLIAIGLVAGFLIGVGITDELTKITVTDSDLTVGRRTKRRHFARTQVSRVQYEDKQLVVWDDQDAEVFRQRIDINPGEVTTALRAHDWPVRD